MWPPEPVRSPATQGTSQAPAWNELGRPDMKEDDRRARPLHPCSSCTAGGPGAQAVYGSIVGNGWWRWSVAGVPGAKVTII